MKQHISSVHEGQNPFKCGICDYGSVSKSVMKSHIAAVDKKNHPNVMSVIILKRSCNYYSFFSKSAMKILMATVHNNRTPFKCDVCYNTCSKKSNINAQKRSVHDGKKHLNVPFVKQDLLLTSP